MLFNSVEFLVFFLVVFVLYWAVFSRQRTARNLFILMANYAFYASWDGRFLLLLIAISTADYVAGLLIARFENRPARKLVFAVAVGINIGTLIYFKYTNFFIESFAGLFRTLGIPLHIHSLSILLPVGISFYTFLSLSYLIDIYRYRKPPARDAIALFASLSFFPILLSGPIHRPTDLIDQFRQRFVFDYAAAADGLRQVLWGLFKKLVIADTCAQSANLIFSMAPTLNGSDLLLGAVFFSFQIYGDFSGYSDIAIGISRMLGFRIVRNFAYPYFARDIGEFWRRWHISLTRWFRDYIFLPVSFYLSNRIASRKVLGMKTDLWIYIVGSIVTWGLTGFWHGASYTFIVWGFLHAILLILFHILRKPHRKTLKRLGIDYKNRWLILWEGAITFLMVTLAWVFFRSESLHSAFAYLRGMFSASLFSLPTIDRFNVVFVLLLLLIEGLRRNREHPLSMDRLPLVVRWMIYAAVAAVTAGFFSKDVPYIYMQF